MSTFYCPDLPPAIPRRGNALTQGFARGLMRTLGWSFRGGLPNLPKAVVIVAPHTSNWDFIVGVVAMFALGARFSWLGKHSLFKGPFGAVMHWLGGIPVDRSKTDGVVEQTVETFNSSSTLLLGLSPEGTRTLVPQWKTGFWHIAHGAGVPIVPVYFDYAGKLVGFVEPVQPSDDLAGDLAALQAALSKATPRRQAARIASED